MNPLLSKTATLSVVKNAAKINLQSVRYNLRHKIKEPLRKPIWQPIAPSKLYQIKKKVELSPQEQAQREHLENTYEINMKSITAFLHKEFYLPTLEAGGRSHEDIVREEEEQKVLIEANEKDNQMVSEMREKRLQEFRADQEARFVTKQMQTEEENRQLGLELDERVRKEIENSKTFITKENLDERIEKVLVSKIVN